ncbi:hypothetical protein [Vitiosangium sp. GDMCC 1.1324]|uniref:hypothetical protein n=1 Tax=Vitiosangium sp. (strain GDMCC 1.1324) TaxID=2138576 RepID=UPI000D4CEF22|nr:hypothetical protein [Vitiosangium sp. GDMCC 1.1324]PTL82576.1 hypothetical protein DAT35_17400 [Vitiosangium sp. GDMCC 1.1324]
MNLTAIALLLALNVAPAESAAAREPPACECGQGRSHQLGGHNFLFPMLQQSAFVSSYVGLRSGAAVYDVPDLPIGRLGTVDVSLTGYQQTLDLGVRLTRWLGLWGQARGTLYAGLTVGSFLSDGANFQAGGDGGLVVRLLHLDSSGTQLSLRGGGGYQQGRELSLFTLVTSILDTPGATLEDILRGRLGELVTVPTSEYSANGGLFLAQALGGSVMGFQASASATRIWRSRRPFDSVLGDRVDQYSTSTRVDLAAALSADFKPLGVPLALMGEYLFTAGYQSEVALARTNLNTSSVGLGLYYSGRPNLQFGLGGVAVLHAESRIGRDSDGNPAKSGRPTLYYGQLILRYIW